MYLLLRSTLVGLPSWKTDREAVSPPTSPSPSLPSSSSSGCCCAPT